MLFIGGDSGERRWLQMFGLSGDSASEMKSEIAKKEPAHLTPRRGAQFPPQAHYCASGFFLFNYLLHVASVGLRFRRTAGP